MSNVPLMAPARPAADAPRVYPLPLLSNERPLNVATPPTALTIFVPASVPPPALVPMAMVTASRAPVTRAPFASRISTCTAGETASPAIALVGWTVNANCVAVCVTVSVAYPGMPRPLALMVVCPGPCAVARPVVSMVAAAGLEEIHRKRTPATVLFPESLAVAANCAVAPSADNPPDPGVTTIPATTCDTVSCTWALLPCANAVMVTVPFATAVATPVAESTVATAGLDECQTIVAVTGWPDASLAVAENCRVRPKVASVSVPAAMLIAATLGPGPVVSLLHATSAARPTRAAAQTEREL